jgi:cell division protease FtsH
MKQDNGSGRKPTDGKSGGQNVVFYLIALAVATTFLVTWFVRNSGHVISYQHLLQLVEANQPDAAGDGAIEVDEQLRDGKERTVRLSNPKNIVVGDRSVRGEVDIEYLSPPFPKKRSLTAAKFVAYKSGSETIEAALIDRLQSSTLDWSSEPEPSRWQAYAPMLIFTGILILFFVIMMRRLGGAGSPMQFGRSRGKLYALEDLGVTFDDAAGIDEAVEEVREIVDFLRSPDKYQRLGGRIPKGVLLVGPPGTGKTLLAKAIAGEANVPFFSLSGSDFVEMFVGVGAARVRDMFQQAESNAPCIIFIDELDALGKTRGASVVGGHDERETDVECPAGRNGWIRLGRGRDRHGCHQSSRDVGSGPAAAGTV